MQFIFMQKFPVNKFEWIEDTFQFNKNFIKTILKKVMKDIFSKDISSVSAKLNELQNDLPFLKERMKIKNAEKLVTNLCNKI